MTTLANRKASKYQIKKHQFLINFIDLIFFFEIQTEKVIIEGDIVINGYPIGNFMHYLSGFMHQEDLFISSLTVAEHLNIMVSDCFQMHNE